MKKAELLDNTCDVTDLVLHVGFNATEAMEADISDLSEMSSKVLTQKP